MRQRRSRVFESRAYQLAKRLDLGSEHFCSRCSVLDRERQCCYSPEYLAHHAWHRVRAVREQLLAATGLSEPRRMRPS
jgi:hypothetical protein